MTKCKSVTIYLPNGHDLTFTTSQAASEGSGNKVRTKKESPADRTAGYWHLVDEIEMRGNTVEVRYMDEETPNAEFFANMPFSLNEWASND
jgi:hypothetical protein